MAMSDDVVHEIKNPNLHDKVQHGIVSGICECSDRQERCYPYAVFS
jgi:hypothetical protein